MSMLAFIKKKAKSHVRKPGTILLVFSSRMSKKKINKLFRNKSIGWKQKKIFILIILYITYSYTYVFNSTISNNISIAD